jgi:carbamoyltransferase
MYLGLNIDQDASACLFKDGEIIWYNEEKKLTTKKLYSGIPYRCIDQVRQKTKNIEQCFITGYNYNALYVRDINHLLKYKGIETKQETMALFTPHHLSHLFKSYIDSGFEEARVFVIDGRGSDWYLSDNSETFETCSIYDINKKNFKCIYKIVYSRLGHKKNAKVNSNYIPNVNKKEVFENYQPFSITNQTKFKISSNLDLGHFYANISSHFNFKDQEGKFMGLQSYGKFNQKYYEQINKSPNEKTINKLPKTIDVAHTCQKFFEDKYLELVKKYKYKNMVFTGGTALNVVNNYKLKKHFKDYNLWFDPLCGDVGNSIGTVYAFMYLNKKKIKPLENIYLGSEINSFEESLQENEMLIKDVNINKVIELLNQGEVVGLIQGKAEAGPRALGNRSLLLDPTLPSAKDIMNRIKKRESFRPFACTIIEEEIDKYFDMEKTQYMMLAAQAKKLAKETIPSLVHIDNTCRVQTINKKQNKILYDILKKFKIPILMNTSFNLSGKSIVEKFSDVLWTVRNSNLKYVYFANHKILLYKNLEKRNDKY